MGGLLKKRVTFLYVEASKSHLPYLKKDLTLLKTGATPYGCFASSTC